MARWVLIGLPGVILGARLAAIIPEEQFEVILGVLMPLLLIPILKKPKARLVDPGAPANAWLPLSRNQKAATLFTFLLLGVYAGFLQAGVGIMILAALGHLVRVDLVRGNYIKLVVPAKKPPWWNKMMTWVRIRKRRR